MLLYDAAIPPQLPFVSEDHGPVALRAVASARSHQDVNDGKMMFASKWTAYRDILFGSPLILELRLMVMMCPVESCGGFVFFLDCFIKIVLGLIRSLHRAC